MMKRQEHGAGVVIYRNTYRGPEFLILKARWNQRLWSVPKGHCNKNESLLTCAFRELQEETGIEQSEFTLGSDFEEIITYNTTKTKKCPDGVKTVRFWLASIDKNVKIQLSKEHAEYKWVSHETSKKYLPAHFHSLIDTALKSVSTLKTF